MSYLTCEDQGLSCEGRQLQPAIPQACLGAVHGTLVPAPAVGRAWGKLGGSPLLGLNRNSENSVQVLTWRICQGYRRSLCPRGAQGDKWGPCSLREHVIVSNNAAPHRDSKVSKHAHVS